MLMTARLLLVLVGLLLPISVAAQAPIRGAGPSGPTPVSVDASGNLTGVNTNKCSGTTISSANINTAAASGNVEIVALSGTTSVYVCGLSLVGEGDVLVQLIVGTGTACATGETDVGSWDLAANTGVTLPAGGALYNAGVAGDALCLETSGAVNVTGMLVYYQE